MTPTQPNALEAPHQLQLDSRARLHMTGVIEVESFDESTIVLTTTRGTLIVRGEGLHLQLLRLDGGEVLVDGTVDALTYEDSQPAGSFLARLFGGWSCRSSVRRSRQRSRHCWGFCLRRCMICCARCEGSCPALRVLRTGCLRLSFSCQCSLSRSIRDRACSALASFWRSRWARQHIF